MAKRGTKRQALVLRLSASLKNLAAKCHKAALDNTLPPSEDVMRVWDDVQELVTKWRRM